MDTVITQPAGSVGLDRALRAMVAAGGSDLHINPDAAPSARVDGRLTPLPGEQALSGPQVRDMVRPIVADDAWVSFQNSGELDMAYEVDGLARFRVNLSEQRGGMAAVLRVIPHHIPKLSSLGVPTVLADFAGLPRGLVLVTGPTGSGKSTTLAALLDMANHSRTDHIVTIEDPIEYVHSHGTCVVSQRQVGEHTASFAEALRRALRQDPDIILIGELRDLETTAAALTAAETGHLVFATMHTKSAVETVGRVVDIFPAGQQSQIRTQLAAVLEGVVTQALLPKRGGGRVPVCEVMVASPAIRGLIRDNKEHMIHPYIAAGSAAGMVTFDQSLARAFQEGVITRRAAMRAAQDPDEFSRLTGGEAA